ncbi:MAG: thioredoxin domain-containing protein [Bryobacteraceae bacterium]|nr:thioredoxin domain-containing protein [Bryobacteraceae bacterium]
MHVMPIQTNRLALEKSPYLLQHAHNPVDWCPWGQDAFAKARSENKPIFLSIGYSTCHWCHVMERESFENDGIAELLNRFFVPVKVDREERPDVDRIYMTFIQATTGGGGWPMSVWLTPDLKPFYGGTYFPPDARYGRPGFRQVLEQLAMAWQNDRERILKSGDEVIDQLRSLGVTSSDARQVIDRGIFESGYLQFRRAFDSRLGGFGGAPKFPRPSALNFLLRYANSTGTGEASEMVATTLREMAKGGMHDQLGGGFHRYSVDARWFVPHFEKMLYDQAQLAIAYLEAYQVSAEPALAETARSIFTYVLRDLTHPDGGFLSAEDADSVADPEHPHEKGEGAFYIWSADELKAILDGHPDASQSANAFEWFAYHYGVENDGNVLDDPQGEFTGRNILYQRFPVAETARRFGVSEQEVLTSLADAKTRLLQVRASRIRPHLDDKVLTAWNGLMISAFAKASRVLGGSEYAQAGHRAADFVLKHLCADNLLFRRWRDGEAAIGGFLDDYAFFVQGLLDLYEAEFEDNHLRSAIELTGRMLELFEDVEQGGFFSSTTADPTLILRIKEDYDGAEPSGNSVAIMNLLRLAHITGKGEYRTSAERALAVFAKKLADGPTSLPQMLSSALSAQTPPRQIVLAGARDTMEPMRAVLRAKFLPFHDLIWAGSFALNPELQNMSGHHGRPTAYVCENFACKLPVSEPHELDGLLQ